MGDKIPAVPLQHIWTTNLENFQQHPPSCEVTGLICSSHFHGLHHSHMDVSKNRGTPKSMVYNGNPIKIHDLGVSLFLETPIYRYKGSW